MGVHVRDVSGNRISDNLGIHPNLNSLSLPNGLTWMISLGLEADRFDVALYRKKNQGPGIVDALRFDITELIFIEIAEVSLVSVQNSPPVWRAIFSQDIFYPEAVVVVTCYFINGVPPTSISIIEDLVAINEEGLRFKIFIDTLTDPSVPIIQRPFVALWRLFSGRKKKPGNKLRP